MARHALAIGEVEQGAPGEAHALDCLLSMAAPQAASVPAAAGEAASAAPSSLDLVRACLQRWLREGAGDALPGMGAAPAPGVEAWTVDTPFSDLGIDLLASVPLALEVEQASGVPVSDELLYDYPTVRLLAA